MTTPETSRLADRLEPVRNLSLASNRPPKGIIAQECEIEFEQGENERRLEQTIMAVRYDQYPPIFVPKIFPISIQLEGETNGDQIDNLREAMAITLLDLIENRIIECEGRKKQEVCFI
jgi:hypothetical protein